MESAGEVCEAADENELLKEVKEIGGDKGGDENEKNNGIEVPIEFIKRILLSDKVFNSRTYSVEQSSKHPPIGRESQRERAVPKHRTSAPVFNRHNSFGYVISKPRRSLPVSVINPIAQGRVPSSSENYSSIGMPTSTPLAHPQPARRESFLYRHLEGSHESLQTAATIGQNQGGGTTSPILSSGVQDESTLLVTPFAQILSSLRNVRTNYCQLLKIDGQQRRSRRSSSTNVDEQSSTSTSSTQNNPHEPLAVETLEELDWILEQLESIQTSKSISEMTTSKFKKMLNKELSQFSESSKSGNQISNFLLSTYIDKQLPELNQITIPTRAMVSDTEDQPFGLILPPSAIDSIGTLLNCLNWNLNIFELSNYTQNPLTVLAYSIFKTHNLFSTFQIQPSTFVTYLTLLESNYQSVPYHNNLHAADVLNSTNILLNLESFESVFTPLEIFGTLFAAMIHDVDHPGVTNLFLINTDSPLALLYNDESILENHHLSVGFKILQSPNADILSSLTKLQRSTFRKLVIDIVLATDMSKHMRLLSNLKTMVETKKVLDGVLCFDEYSDRIQVLQTLVHCADLSNPTKELSLYKVWVGNVMKEFWDQGDREIELGLDVSFDRNNSSVEKTQVGFIDYIVHPLWETWNELIQHSLTLEILDILECNREFYFNLITPSPPVFKLTLDEEEAEESGQ